MSIGVPIKVLHEAEGHIVTCETNTGEVYRGKLIEAEDNMNCQMSNITVTYRDGRVAQLEQKPNKNDSTILHSLHMRRLRNTQTTINIALYLEKDLKFACGSTS
uniref:Small nuclear ribonucleoprotein Sm D3 n=1 Tax=Canis lupus dingo TaxID=286419 RepID=A0A8C0LGY5_CANLU